MYIPAKVAMEILKLKEVKDIINLIASRKIKGKLVEGNGPRGNRWKVDLGSVLEYKEKICKK